MSQSIKKILMAIGIWNMVKLSYPIVYVLFNGFLLIGFFGMHKEYIWIATAFNIFIVGFIAEACTIGIVRNPLGFLLLSYHPCCLNESLLNQLSHMYSQSA
jgi:hypothetical protein